MFNYVSKKLFSFSNIFSIFFMFKKKTSVLQEPSDKEKAMELYQEAITNMDGGYYFQAVQHNLQKQK